MTRDVCDKTRPGVIFDMDGVLVDSEPLHARAWEAIFPQYGIPFEAEWFVPWVGIADETLAGHLCATHTLDAGKDELLGRKRDTYRARISEELVVFPGVLEGLKRLAHLPLAVATSSSRHSVEMMLTTVGIRESFLALVTADDVIHRKPAPEPFLKAAALLGRTPERCYALEDSPAGLASARAAGCVVLGITTSHEADRLRDADYLFSTTAEAIAWIADRHPVVAG